MYQAVYKCRLCGEKFLEDEELVFDEFIGVDFERKIIIDKNMETHSFLIRNSHVCKDGSIGMVDLQGYRKSEVSTHD